MIQQILDHHHFWSESTSCLNCVFNKQAEKRKSRNQAALCHGANGVLLASWWAFRSNASPTTSGMLGAKVCWRADGIRPGGEPDVVVAEVGTSAKSTTPVAEADVLTCLPSLHRFR
ncbi:MAG TPA: hypothetical protein DEP84_11395 [Chloroflexi bacterium]|nr:hypothetical protein [Chloroflexota bacterium]